MKTRLLSEVLETHPGFYGKVGWKPLELGGMENPRFGSLEHVAICDDAGNPLFDQYMITEAPGSIVLPYDTQNGIIRVGLITEERPVPGKDYVAAPRGFGNEDEDTLQAAYRELLEESGLKAESLEIIGRVNVNTAFYRTNIPIVAAPFDQLEAIQNPKGDGFAEKIKGSAPYSFSDIRQLQLEGRMECGLTLAALSTFGMHKPAFYKS